MRSKRIPAVAIGVVSLVVSVLAVLGSRATSAQDAGQAKYTVRVPNGLAFSEFRGYEGWQAVSINLLTSSRPNDRPRRCKTWLPVLTARTQSGRCGT